MDSYVNDSEFSSADAPPPVLTPDGKLSSESTEQRPESEENQITITIMDSGDVQIMDTEGKNFLIRQATLLTENIDTNDLTDDSIRKLIQMAIPSSHNGLTQSENTLEAGDGEQCSTFGSRKRRAKELFDPSSSVMNGHDNQLIGNNKRRKKRSFIKENSATYPHSTLNIDAVSDNTSKSLINGNSNTHRGSVSKVSMTTAVKDALTATTLNSNAQKIANLTKFNGVTIYKPSALHSTVSVNQIELQEQQQSTSTTGSDVPVPGPRFCCAVCDKPIPKTKVDFILLRLPAHTHCAKNTMMVLSDEEDDDDRKHSSAMNLH